MNHFIYPISNEFGKINFIEGARDGKYPYSHSLLIGDFLLDTGISSRLLRKLIKELREEGKVYSPKRCYYSLK